MEFHISGGDAGDRIGRPWTRRYQHDADFPVARRQVEVLPLPPAS